ncbi:MAG: hypothetical protein ACJAQ3_000711 [Planctomycetota bacterium]|jgi:hypothetical protein
MLALASLLLPAVALTGAGSSSPAANESSLLAALPSGTIAALHVPNPRALIASRETNRWVGFATDPQWDRFIGQSLAAIGDNVAAAEVRAWRENVLGSMSDSTSMVLFLAGDPSDNATPPTVGLIARGGDESAKLLRRFIGTDAKKVTLAGGEEVLLSASGRAELYYEANGLILVLSTPTVDESRAIAEECFASLMDGELPALFAQPGVAERRRPEAAFELAVDMDLIWNAAKRTQTNSSAFEKRLFESASSMGWLYGSGELGLGEETDWNFYAPYAAKSILGEALGFFGEADRSLLGTAPADAVSATVGAFDISGFAQWALGITQEVSEEAHAQALAGLSAAKAAVGIDLMKEIITPMTGQFFGFSSAPSAKDADSLMALAGVGTSTLVALTQNTDPLLDLVESLVEMSGMGQGITSETMALGTDDREMELYRSDETTGIPITLGVGDGRVLVSMDAGGSNAYLDLLLGKEGAMALLDVEDLKQAAKNASGAIITIQPTVAFANVLDGAAEMMDAFSAATWLPEWAPNEEEEAPPSMVDAMGGVSALAREYFSGTTTTEIKIGRGLIHLHTYSK